MEGNRAVYQEGGLTPTDEAIIRRLARMRGWKPCDRVAMGWGCGPDVWLTGDEESPTYQGFDPLNSISDTRECMLALPEEKRGRFSMALYDLIRDNRQWADVHWSECLWATPRQISLAVYEAIGGEDGKD
jgi:hypothetical protein